MDKRRSAKSYIRDRDPSTSPSVNLVKETLGMPRGTANGKLHRSLLFQLVQQAQRDVCYRCGLLITRVCDLTVDHKVPWLGVSADLFFDLDNIAFSHKWCNRPDRPSIKIERMD